jgi:hypothetical protein
VERVPIADRSTTNAHQVKTGPQRRRESPRLDPRQMETLALELAPIVDRSTTSARRVRADPRVPTVADRAEKTANRSPQKRTTATSTSGGLSPLGMPL